MRPVWRLAAVAVTVLCAAVVCAPAMAQTTPSSAPLKWGPFIDFEGKVGTRRNLGTGDLFVPFLQNSTSMLFADIRGRFDDHSDDEGNFGLGIRHMLESGWNVGAYGYYDRRRTELGSTFGQATFGAEALSLDWDLRANVYQPVGSSVRDVSSSASTSTSTTNSSTAALTDTAIQVTTVTTTTNTTSTVTTQDVEQKGFDAEIGWRVPVFAAIDTTQLRLYAGAYRFYANGTNATQGPRGRIDLTIAQVPHLWEGARLELGTEVQNDGPRGTQAFAEARLRIPLQIFGQPPAELTALERRMEDPIVRDVDIVSQPHAATATTSTSSSSTTVANATQDASGNSLTFLNSTTTTGANLPTAVTNAGDNSTVILNGTFNTTASVSLNTGQTLTAGTVTVKTASGFSANVTTSATIAGTNGPILVTVLANHNNVTVSNLTLSNTATNAGTGPGVVSVGAATGVVISNNTISSTISNGGNSNNAVAVTISPSGAGASASVTLTNNRITATTNGAGADNGVGVTVDPISGATATVTVSGNTINSTATGGGTGFSVGLVGNTIAVNAGSTGNVRQAGSCTSSATSVSGQIGFTDGSHCP